MTSGAECSRDEVERIRRVADQLCTGHADMRDRFSRRTVVMDVIVLMMSAWLTALAFVDSRFNQWIVPLGMDAQLWVGLLGVATFCMTLIQFKLDWAGKGEAHKRSFEMYAEVKREAGYLLASNDEIPQKEFQRLAARYDMASDTGRAIPESDFLRLKRKHKMKVAVSKLLDRKPGASIVLTKMKLFARDNWPF